MRAWGTGPKNVVESHFFHLCIQLLVGLNSFAVDILSCVSKNYGLPDVWCECLDCGTSLPTNTLKKFCRMVFLGSGRKTGGGNVRGHLISGVERCYPQRMSKKD